MIEVRSKAVPIFLSSYLTFAPLPIGTTAYTGSFRPDKYRAALARVKLWRQGRDTVYLNTVDRTRHHHPNVADIAAATVNKYIQRAYGFLVGPVLEAYASAIRDHY
ncbi:hypothetical protein BH09PAT4_BH09PAT4_09710 [soil metagenome]